MFGDDKASKAGRKTANMGYDHSIGGKSASVNDDDDEDEKEQDDDDLELDTSETEK